MNCQYCQGSCIKKGRIKKSQLYRCKSCQKYQRSVYQRKRITTKEREQVKDLSNEGVGISSIGRLLNMSKASVVKTLRTLSNTILKPVFEERNQEYEIDELYTYCGKKNNECWIIYAINKVTKRIVEVSVGRRTKENIGTVVKKLIELNPKRIYSDHLNIYRSLINRNIHSASQYKINGIERMNLNLRKDQKYLNRKTICYAKSTEMIEAKLKIYFWG